MKRVGEESQDFDLATGKRKRILNPLDDDVIISILERLPPLDLVRSKSLSKYWNSFVETLESHSRFVKSPRLILPPKQDASSYRFMNLEENTVHNLNKTTSDMFLEFQCVGSSHEWLIFWNEKTSTPFLFNSLTLHRIQLPPLQESFLQSPSKIHKAILTSKPDSDRYGVLLIIGGKLVYHKYEDTSWTRLVSSDEGTYQDAICFGNALYAIQEGGSIWTWDFKGNNDSFRKIIDVPISKISNKIHINNYLVDVNGEILLARKYFIIGKSYFFDLFKLDLEKEGSSSQVRLGDWSLFLGMNQSVAVSSRNMRNCKRNSVYCTSNCSFQGMGSGGDMGIYDLKEMEITSLFEFPLETGKLFLPTPEACWIVPSEQ